MNLAMMMPGRATHLAGRPWRRRAACGEWVMSETRVVLAVSGVEPQGVDCRRCRKTWLYRTIGKESK